jgi:transposase
VTYEAGPTGFGLARALTEAGIDCRVAAPSKLQCPAGDRVKTDARDAAHLTRLLHLGQNVAVRVRSVAREAARDLIRAREDCRGDLMATRHRISKLVLRQGIVYYGGQAWTGKHELWLGPRVEVEHLLPCRDPVKCFESRPVPHAPNSA